MRNGNAQQIMSLSKENTTALWNSVKDSMLRLPHPSSPIVMASLPLLITMLADILTWLPCSDDYTAFNKVNTRLLNASRGLKNVPIRLYIPQSPDSTIPENASAAGSFKVVQSLVSPRANERKFRCP